MVKLAVVTAAALAAFGIAVAAATAEGPPQPPPLPDSPGTPNPWPGAKAQGIFFYVETVTASPGESIYGKAAPQRCTQTNFFTRGERAVFHISAVDTHNGNILLPADVKYAYIQIPGMNNIRVSYVVHGKDPTSPWTWTARWDIPPDYPLGVVPFKLVMKLKDWTKNKVAVFTQIPIPLEQLTVIGNR